MARFITPSLEVIALYYVCIEYRTHTKPIHLLSSLKDSTIARRAPHIYRKFATFTRLFNVDDEGNSQSTTAVSFLSTPSKDLISLGMYVHRNMRTVSLLLYPVLVFHARSLETLRYILEDIAPPAANDVTPYRQVPLERASLDVFKYVIERSGRDVSLPSVYNILMGIRTGDEWLEKMMYVLSALSENITYRNYAIIRKVVEDGDVEMLKKLLENVLDKMSLPHDLLAVASCQRHWSMVTYILSNEFGRRKESIHHDRDVALYDAVCCRQHVVVECLLRDGASPQASATAHGWNAFIAYSLEMECMELMVKNGLHFKPQIGRNKMTITDMSPIIVHAIDARLVTAMESCLKFVEPHEITIKYRRNWLGRAASYVGTLTEKQDIATLLAIVKLLVCDDAQVSSEILILCHDAVDDLLLLKLIPKCYDLSSYLSTAMERSDVEVMKAIARHPRTRTVHMLELLNMGISVELLEVLLTELSSVDMSGHLPQWLASCVSKDQALALMKRGVTAAAVFIATCDDDTVNSPRAGPPVQCTVLHNACTSGRLGLIEALLESGGDPNLEFLGVRPLFALLQGSLSYDRVCRCMRVLIKHGANVNTVQQGQPFSAALIKKYFTNSQVEELQLSRLLDCGLDITVSDINGNPLVHQLALLGHDKPLRYICKRTPAAVSMHNSHGYSALGLVLMHMLDLTLKNPPNYSRITGCLLEFGAKESECFPAGLVLRDLHWVFDDAISSIPVSPLLCAACDDSPDAHVTIGRILNYYGFDGSNPSHCFAAFRIANSPMDPSALAVDLGHDKTWRRSFLITMYMVINLVAKPVRFVGVYRDIVILSNLTAACGALRQVSWMHSLVQRVKDKMSKDFPRLIMSEFADLGVDTDLYLSPAGLLFSRCLVGDAPAVQQLLSLGVRPVSLGNYTVLHAAALANDSCSSPHDVIRYLSESGMLSNSIVSTKCPKLGTALHVAAKKGSAVAVKVLLDMGADTRATDRDGRVPLHKAAQYAHSNTIDVLMDSDAEASNVPDKDGRTPMELFLRRRRVLVSLTKKRLVNVISHENILEHSMGVDTYLALRGDIRAIKKIMSNADLHDDNDGDGDDDDAHSLVYSTISSNASDVIVKDLFHVFSKDAVIMKRVLSSGGLLIEDKQEEFSQESTSDDESLRDI